MQILLWNLAFPLKGHGVPRVSLSICLSLSVNLFLVLVKCRAVTIDVLRLAVCWNHVDGVVV
jgi:hypothetical protein